MKLKKIKIDNKRIGESIAQSRKSKGLTQEELAELVGLTRQFISMVERGKTGIGLITFLNLSSILEIEPSEILLGGDDWGSIPPPLIKIAKREDLRWQTVLSISRLPKKEKESWEDLYQSVKSFIE